MSNEPFDPKTVTAEELAAYSRKVRRARHIGIVVGLAAVLPAFWVAMRMLPDGADWMAILIVVLVPIGLYRLTFEVLKPTGASINE